MLYAHSRQSPGRILAATSVLNTGLPGDLEADLAREASLRGHSKQSWGSGVLAATGSWEGASWSDAMEPCFMPLGQPQGIGLVPGHLV